MNALTLVLLFLACYSITFGWIESPLFKEVKQLKFFKHEKFKYLTFCYHCSGFWISLIVALIYYKNFVLSLLLALSFSIVMVWLNTVLVLIQSFIKKEEK